MAGSKGTAILHTFTLEYDKRKIQENHLRLEMNELTSYCWCCQFIIQNHIYNKNTKVLLQASKVAGQKINTQLCTCSTKLQYTGS
jgi:hypothetical protein